VQVDANSLYVRDGKFYTSAGITAGIDLALALIEEDFGAQVSLSVARELVMYLKRPGDRNNIPNLEISSRVELAFRRSRGVDAGTSRQ